MQVMHLSEGQALVLARYVAEKELNNTAPDEKIIRERFIKEFCHTFGYTYRQSTKDFIKPV